MNQTLQQACINAPTNVMRFGLGVPTLHPIPYTLNPEQRHFQPLPSELPVCARAIQGECGRKRERARGGGWYEACTHTKSACPAAVEQRLCDACVELEHHVMATKPYCTPRRGTFLLTSTPQHLCATPPSSKSTSMFPRALQVQTQLVRQT